MQIFVRWIALISLGTLALSACGEAETTTQTLNINNNLNNTGTSTPARSAPATPANPSNSPHPAALAARRYYEAIQVQDCAKAAALRPGYSEQRCQRIKHLAINEVRLDAAREDAAAVYIDISYQGKDNTNTTFTGLLLAKKAAQGWVLQNDFKRYDALTTSPEVFLNEYLPPTNNTNTAQQTATPPSAQKTGGDKASDKTTQFLMGHFDPKRRDNFVTIESQYASRSGMKLQKEAYESFKAMHAAAKKDGIKLVIKSATRNFSYQRGIWEAKWNGSRAVDGQNLAKTMPDPKQRALKILQYSAMPGSSRHHWGTDIDLNSFNNNYFASGKGKREYEWLTQNAPRFGFCQTYTAKGQGRNTGYNEEKWHWSYLPLSKAYTQQAGQLTNQQFSGFSGAATAGQIDIVNNYVLGIDHRCF